MNPKNALAQLEALGNEKMRAQNTRNGAGKNQYGVRLGDIRGLAKKIKSDHELDRMVHSVKVVQVEDWLSAYAVKQHPDKETLRQKWMTAADPMAARPGWSLTAERVAVGVRLGGSLTATSVPIDPVRFSPRFAGWSRENST